jgi:GAF domain-containing protein
MATDELHEEIAELRRQLDEEVGTLNRLVELASLLNSTLNLDELLQLIMSSAAELLRAETSSLLLLDEDTGQLTVAVAVGESGREAMKHTVPAGSGIAGWVIANDEPLVVDDAPGDPRFYAGIDEKTGFQTRSILAAPLRTKERVIGAIEVINKLEGPFTAKDRDVADALATLAAVAIENTRMYAALADAVVASRLSYRL